MPKFEITYTTIERYVDVIEAKTHTEAYDKMCELMEDEEYRSDHHNDSDGDYDWDEVE